MKNAKLVILITAGALSFFCAGLWAQSGVFGRVEPLDPAGPALTGVDIAFQPTERPSGNGTVQGYWIVRVDGQWLVASAPLATTPASR